MGASIWLLLVLSVSHWLSPDCYRSPVLSAPRTDSAHLHSSTHHNMETMDMDLMDFTTELPEKQILVGKF
jgi:hypothetical protein